MERTPSRDHNTITVSVVIRRPVEQVFNFYRDFTNLPKFLGDVMKIEPNRFGDITVDDPRPIWNSSALEGKSD